MKGGREREGGQRIEFIYCLFQLVILYAVSAVYFAGVMVRLMLTLTPLVCSMASITASHLLDTFLDTSSKDGQIPSPQLTISPQLHVHNTYAIIDFPKAYQQLEFFAFVKSIRKLFFFHIQRLIPSRPQPSVRKERVRRRSRSHRPRKESRGRKRKKRRCQRVKFSMKRLVCAAHACTWALE